ncbi:MAG: 1-deoxy-D-xylulose-5-phosphate synthase [Coriobacteriales bacterium]|jgi:1-deoxy-D-xylulose-5-phosphate synthase|nr:1-deoxy-D-xylulose-5-phosphate synthase [Coriobacteriales bacterium]
MEECILQRIERPSDLQALSTEESEKLAAEIRERLIEVTAQTGGHLAPSLGTVELTLALHRAYDFSIDRLVFDVGHQSYAHKLITGRDGRFDTLRTFEGICGFPRRDESPYDAHESGHASDSLSIACGLAAARDLRGSNEQIVVLIGDAALSGGMAFEALNQIGHDQRNITIILNDNEMSIARNVGALSLYLGKARMSKPYTLTRDTVEGGLSRFGRPGRLLVRAGERVKSSVKKLFVPGMFFEDMGIKYIGPIDGHSSATLNDVIERAKTTDGPTLIHAVTKKGLGYEPAEKRPDLFHGIGPFDQKTGEVLSKPSKDAKSFTSIFSDALIAEAEHNPDIVAITAAMEDGTGLAGFKKKFGKRFFDVGIAEEHAVALAAGLALGKKLPVVAIYSTFLQRAFDQMAINVALQDQHVVFCVDRAGLVGEDGPTHHGAFDLAYLRAIPNMRILAPTNESDFRDALHTALALTDGPVALRYPRALGEVCAKDKAPEVLPVAQARRLRSGDDVALLAVGRFVGLALAVADLLAEQGIKARVENMLWVKPLDKQAVSAAAKTKLIVTLEDGTTTGGFGSAVLESLARLDKPSQTPVLTLGLPDEFITHGSVACLFESLGLTAPQITATILKKLQAL